MKKISKKWLAVAGLAVATALLAGFTLRGNSAPQYVTQKVERREKIRIERVRVEGRVLLGGEGVDVAADRVDRLGDVLGGPGRGSLEQEVLEEVRDARLCVRLVTRSGADPEPERDRPDRRHRLGHDADARVELRERVALPGHG